MTKPKWYNSLRIQIVLLMTLALLPLGAVAIYQTNRVENQAHRNTELALLALTGRAAKSEELILERASGVVSFFATVAEDFIKNPGRCTDELSQFIGENDSYSFIGILPKSGHLTCSSSGEALDLSDWPNFGEIVAAQERIIVVNQQASLNGESVFVISKPFNVQGEFAGFISLAVPHEGIPETTAQLSELGLKELLTFNAQGDILTARTPLDQAAEELPRDRDLRDLNVTRRFAFVDQNQRGERRIYTVVPIEGSPATIIGIWRVDDGLASRLGEYLKPAVFPILMWFASMAVAMLAIYKLILRHIASLCHKMDRFSDDRSIESVEKPVAMPTELQALTDNFDEMTNEILREEARLEDTLREKNVLIKEVHHRVKNNLQLISSIMNMHIRTAQQDETKSVLSRVQDRVLSLATIHRDLYQSQHGGMVDVGALVTEIIEKTVDVGMSLDTPVDVVTDIDHVLLYPDQAVPLSLLAAEGVTNAMKYVGRSDTTKPRIRASLKHDETACVLTMVNSIGGEPYDMESTGLGAQLINAFAIQLGGQITIDETKDQYTLTLRFEIAEFVPDGRDF